MDRWTDKKIDKLLKNGLISTTNLYEKRTRCYWSNSEI